MALDAEWMDRVNIWMHELECRQALPGPCFPVEWARTFEQLDYEQAVALPFEPVEPGQTWGERWQYAWFRSKVTIPEEYAGKNVYIQSPAMVSWRIPAGEGLLWVDGRICAGQAGWGKRYILLTPDAEGGRTHEVLFEIYAGHEYVQHPGPTTRNRFQEHADSRWQSNANSVRAMQIGVIREDAAGLHYDVQTLYHLRERLPADSLRVAEIDASLKDFTYLCDPSLEDEQAFLESCRAARRRLAPLLACKNGDTTPTMYTFGHGHLDVMWLWPLAETRRKTARTLSNQLQLVSMYPEHNFLHSQAHLFWMLREDYPEFYARVKQAVGDGRILADGAMWVEADMNISGGEALIRQILHGKQFFREEFGVESEFLWLPDVFGYNAQLPQIMRKCGVKYFSTQKIFWTYHGGAEFPYNTFWWEGLDGSEVLTHLHNDYNSQLRPDFVVDRWNTRVQKDGIRSRLMPFGWGDGGGGPSYEHLEYYRRCQDLEGCPKLRMAHPVEFFEDVLAEGGSENRYVGELYFQCHRGTLTSQAKTKLGNRRCEQALREVEFWASLAAMRNGSTYPWETLREAWITVMLNQFHDILPGSSIGRVYEEVEASYEKVLTDLTPPARDARRSLLGTSADSARTVFNSLGWERSALVELPEDWPGMIDSDGDSLCVQEVAGRKVVETTVPSCGWTTLRRADQPHRESCCGCGVQAELDRLENDVLRATFNASGELTSLMCKTTGREFLAGAGNVMRMYQDIPSRNDAWDIDSMYVDLPVDLDSAVEVEVVASGALLGRLRVTRTLNQSTLTQEITLRRGSRRLEFHTVVDWRETHKLLKVDFETNVRAENALQEIQFGHVQRPTHRNWEFDKARFEVANHKYTALAESNRGLAVLNDCKYGVSVLGGSINLTLLRAPLAPDPDADQGRQEFTYAVLPWDGPFAQSGVVEEGYDLNHPVTAEPGDGGRESLLQLDLPGVVLEALKLAEDGSGDLVLRLYESLGSATRGTVSVKIFVESVVETDMLENFLGTIQCEDGKFTLDFLPFEIKTIRIASPK
jgi:alpha-mannosidase